MKVELTLYIVCYAAWTVAWWRLFCFSNCFYLFASGTVFFLQLNTYNRNNSIFACLFLQALCFNLLHLDESLYTQAARNNGLIEQNVRYVVGLAFSRLFVCIFFLIYLARFHTSHVFVLFSIDIVRLICSLTVRFIEDGGHASTVAICLNILAQMLKW